MATAIIRPTAHLQHSSSSADIDNMVNLYDNSLTTYSKFSSTSSVGVLTNFDTSAISPQIQKITSIKFCLNYKQGSGTKPRAKPVYNATSTVKYTRIGNGENAYVSNLISGNDYYADFPDAVSFWNARLAEFMSGGFQVRLYSGNTGDILYEAYAIVEYEVPTITVTTNASPTEGGTVTGGGTYESGSTVTATAYPNNGYVFSHWLINGVNSGNSNPISGALTEDTTVTAVFEKISFYVTFDSILNFQKWKDNGITSGNGVVSNISGIGFDFTASVDDAYTRESPIFPVEKGQTYTLECNVFGSPFQIFVFNCPTLNGDWGNMPAGQQFTYKDNETKFEFTALTDYITIRCDSVGTGTTVKFENFRIYPSECDYMSTTVSAQNRSNTSEWNIPTPERPGYSFLGWNTKPDGSGILYTENSAFPDEDTVLYSQWEVITLPEISSVQIIPNPCNAGQGLVISVEFI